MKLFKLTLATILITPFISCTKAIIDPEETQTTDTTTVIENIKYTNDIADIMYNNCVTCHSGASPSASLSLSTYNAVKNSTENGTLIQRINNAGSPMPPSGLMSATDREKIQVWADNNYTN